MEIKGVYNKLQTNFYTKEEEGQTTSEWVSTRLKRFFEQMKDETGSTF